MGDSSFPEGVSDDAVCVSFMQGGFMEFLSYSSSVLIRPLQSNAGVQGRSMGIDGTTSAKGGSLEEAAAMLCLDDQPKLSSREADRAWEGKLDESAVCV